MKSCKEREEDSAVSSFGHPIAAQTIHSGQAAHPHSPLHFESAGPQARGQETKPQARLSPPTYLPPSHAPRGQKSALSWLPKALTSRRSPAASVQRLGVTQRQPGPDVLSSGAPRSCLQALGGGCSGDRAARGCFPAQVELARGSPGFLPHSAPGFQGGSAGDSKTRFLFSPSQNSFSRKCSCQVLFPVAKPPSTLPRIKTRRD